MKLIVRESRYTRQRGVKSCDSETCDYLLTYRVTPGDIAHFEMSARAGWVAVGFSSDDLMVCISVDRPENRYRSTRKFGRWGELTS